MYLLLTRATCACGSTEALINLDDGSIIYQLRDASKLNFLNLLFIPFLNGMIISKNQCQWRLNEDGLSSARIAVARDLRITF